MANRKYENSFNKEGYHNVVGLDEAGRGCLVGPLVVAAVVLPEGYSNSLINDSKQLSDKQRRILYPIIKEVALTYDIQVLSVEEVDELNVYQGSMQGMHRCLKKLKGKYDAILTDAMPLQGYKEPVVSLIHGDAKSVSIAAASILAKVYRDDLLIELDKKYPEYGWKSNKGYGTKKHIEAIEKYGITPHHRKTFEPIASMLRPTLFDVEK